MKQKLVETAGLEVQRTLCDESSWRRLVPTSAFAGGLLMAKSSNKTVSNLESLSAM